MVTLGFTGTGEGSLGGQEEPDAMGRADEKQIRRLDLGATGKPGNLSPLVNKNREANSGGEKCII